jgi:hypothetical protein
MGMGFEYSVTDELSARKQIAKFRWRQMRNSVNYPNRRYQNVTGNHWFQIRESKCQFGGMEHSPPINRESGEQQLLGKAS